MALFNYATRELSAKIVYYGPGLSGKTTNIEMVHKMLRADQKGRLISLPTQTDRTLFFDFLPIELGQIKGFKVRFHLYTVPGQVFYNATRRLVLQGVDGVVFVADSQREMINSDVESLKNLMDNLSAYGKKLEDLPFVLQYNKRDLRSAAPVAELNAALNLQHVPAFEAVAPTGKGVAETLVGISRMVFSHLRKTLLMPGEMAAHDDIGDLADARIRKTFATPPAEPIEEITDIEEIREVGEPFPAVTPPAPVKVTPPAPIKAAPTAPVEERPQAKMGEVDLEPTSLRVPEAAPPGWLEDLSEIKVEIPEMVPEPPPPAPVETAPPTPVEERPQATVGEVDVEPMSPRVPEAPPPAGFEELSEIKVEIPEKVPEPPPPAPVETAPPTPVEERPQATVGEVDVEPMSPRVPEAPPPAGSEELSEIEVEIPEKEPERQPPSVSMSVAVEGTGLTFLKFEAPFVSPDGQAVLPALFIDAAGNPVRLRIRVMMDEG
ncbi:MAG TPA: ADP-ribosylation factor-like protein [Candidatus Deferrimicrobium sp.]